MICGTGSGVVVGASIREAKDIETSTTSSLTASMNRGYCLDVPCLDLILDKELDIWTRRNSVHIIFTSGVAVVHDGVTGVGTSVRALSSNIMTTVCHLL